MDLRPVHKFTLKHGFLMQNIEQDVGLIAVSNFYANFDLSNGHWQFPLRIDSQECQSFVTSDGDFTPTCILHGTTNAVTYLQSTLASILPLNLLQNVLYWLDKVLVHHATVDSLLEAIRLLFAFFKSLNINIHPSECCFFATSIEWCGRLFSRSGIKFDPRRLQGIQKMDLPATNAQLQQVLCALHWVKTVLPIFSRLVEPFYSSMGIINKAVHARTKRGVAQVLLSAIRWSQKASEFFIAAVQHSQSKLRYLIETSTSAFASTQKRQMLSGRGS